VLVTGAKGMLGTDVVEALAGDHKVTAQDIDDFDIRDLSATTQAIRKASPEAIIHVAAFTDVEACEERSEFARQSNGDGTLNVALGAKAVGAFVVYMSTDYVFDGAKRVPYLEADEPSPINAYGASKLAGERYLAETTPDHLIVRTSWLFGPNGRNFIDTIMSKARSGARLKVVNDQRGCPTYTGHLAAGIKAALERGLRGILHMTNSGDTTWYDLARYALALAGVKSDIEPVPGSAYPTRAKRPAYSVLASTVMAASGIGDLPPWGEGVKCHLARRGMIAGE
jgi:dTDP-4-dehydrorhamnose reductase